MSAGGQWLEPRTVVLGIMLLVVLVCLVVSLRNIVILNRDARWLASRRYAADAKPAPSSWRCFMDADLDAEYRANLQHVYPDAKRAAPCAACLASSGPGVAPGKCPYVASLESGKRGAT